MLANIDNCLVNKNGGCTTGIGSRRVDHKRFRGTFGDRHGHVRRRLNSRCSRLTTGRNCVGALHRRILGHLVSRTLLSRCTHRLGLNVDSRRIGRTVFTAPTFRISNGFSGDHCGNVLGRVKVATSRCTRTLHGRLAARRLVGNITNASFVLGNRASRLTTLITRRHIIHRTAVSIGTLTTGRPIARRRVTDCCRRGGGGFVAPRRFHIDCVGLSTTAVRRPIDSTSVRDCCSRRRSRFARPRHAHCDVVRAGARSRTGTMLSRLGGNNSFTTLTGRGSTSVVSTHGNNSVN